MENTIYNSVN